MIDARIRAGCTKGDVIIPHIPPRFYRIYCFSHKDFCFHCECLFFDGHQQISEGITLELLVVNGQSPYLLQNHL